MWGALLFGGEEKRKKGEDRENRKRIGEVEADEWVLLPRVHIMSVKITIKLGRWQNTIVSTYSWVAKDSSSTADTSDSLMIKNRLFL